jgi:hypothetical protein
MPPTIPQVQPLPRAHRRFIFAMSVTIFAVTVPLLVFYAIGYRFDFSEGAIRNIMSVGGMYINTDAENVAIYVDDEPVEDLRIFQRAAYIQNLEAGVHQVHVQGEGVQTWVKELPVFSHYVTEAAAFNMPLVPQIRVIGEFQTADGAVVVDATNTPPFTLASSTQRFILASSTVATSTYIVNPEFTYVANRFASTTEERTLLEEFEALVSRTVESFTFEAPDQLLVPTTTATTTIQFNDMELYERNGEVYAAWQGSESNIPYYFCVNPLASSSPTYYGEHVTAQLISAASSTLFEAYSAPVFEAPNRLCRTEIKIDRLRQAVTWFTFMPDSRDHVLMHLSDGIYVVEIDDRAWQNTQLLYPGQNLTLLIDSGRILVQDGDTMFEVFTELQR